MNAKALKRYGLWIETGAVFYGWWALVIFTEEVSVIGDILILIVLYKVLNSYGNFRIRINF